MTRAELLHFLRDIQDRMADTAQRVRVRIGEVFEEAIEQGTVSLNPVAMLRAKLCREHKPKRRTPHPALGYRDAPEFLQTLREQSGIAARFTLADARVGMGRR
jgi:hypothetical protein